MKLSSLLEAEYILVGNDIRTKKDAVETILEEFKGKYNFTIDFDYVRKTIEEREQLGGTSYESGIAIPHARLDNFDDILIGILIPANPVMDGNTQLSMIVLILTSKTVSNVYLNTLASLV